MPKPRTYWTMVEREHVGADWSPQFGDYDKATVADEMADMIHTPADAKRFCIIKSGDSQASINEAVTALNADWRNQ